MNVGQIIPALESIAPLDYAADWDNVGLLAGSRQWLADSILLTIDLTAAVLQEASDSKTNLVIAYHPPIFSAFKSLTDRDMKQRIILDALAAGIAIYSPHTALDAAPGGVNDWLASGIGQGDVRALVAHESLPESEQCKIITFCPPEAVDSIRNGLAAVGAGRIGNYQLCSFEIAGRGTFMGGENTNPQVGKRGSLQYVDEVRLEMVCSRAGLALAMISLREFHPYEEPPMEIIPLLARPQRNIGEGRRVTLDQPISLRTLVGRIKRQLRVKSVQVALPDSASDGYERIGLCVGAGGSLLDAAIAQECTAFVTGEMRHHDVLAAQARGCTVILAGHTNTERGYLKPYRRRLMDALPKVEIAISRKDGDPLRLM